MDRLETIGHSGQVAMRVVINGLLVGPGQVGGLETYIRGLIDGLVRTDTENTYILVVGPEAAPTFALPSGRWRIVVSPAPSKRRALRLALEQVWLPVVAKSLRADILHSTANTGPLLSRVPTVATIHDIKYKAHPDTFSLSERMVFAALLPQVARRSCHVISDSEAIRTEIVRWTGIPSAQVTPVPLAPRRGWPGDPTDDPARLAALGLSDPYILSVAGSYPHKNLARLVDAFPITTEEGRPVQLVLVGLKGRGHETVEALAGKRADLIKLMGWVDDASLATLYRNALALAFPSLYEGFGLPILEAMSFGTPVLTSNYGAMAEVAGDAAVLINPADTHDIRRGLSKIAQDPRQREHLRELGYFRAGQFSWERTANMTAAVYERLHKAIRKVET